jgi:hypothetical protein
MGLENAIIAMELDIQVTAADAVHAAETENVLLAAEEVYIDK